MIQSLQMSNLTVWQLLQGAHLSYYWFYQCHLVNGRLSQPHDACKYRTHVILIFVPACYHSNISPLPLHVRFITWLASLCLSMYFLRFSTHWCRLRSIRFQSYSFYGGVICTPPPTLHVPFLVPVARFRGVHEAEISIQISILAGVWTLDLAV